jgi:hypothetical protein
MRQAKHIVAALSIALMGAGAAFAAPTAQLVGGQTSVALDPGFVSALTDRGVTPAPIGPATLDPETGQATFPLAAGAADLETLAAEILHTGGLSLTAEGAEPLPDMEPNGMQPQPDGVNGDTNGDTNGQPNGDDNGEINQQTEVELLNFIIETNGGNDTNGQDGANNQNGANGSNAVLTALAVVNGDLVGRIALFDLTLNTEPAVSPFGVIVLEGVQATLNSSAADTLNTLFGVDDGEDAFGGGLPVGSALVVALTPFRPEVDDGENGLQDRLDDLRARWEQWQQELREQWQQRIPAGPQE